MQLLIEGGSYSRGAFINFRLILDGVIHKVGARTTGLRRLHFDFE